MVPKTVYLSITLIRKGLLLVVDFSRKQSSNLTLLTSFGEFASSSLTISKFYKEGVWSEPPEVIIEYLKRMGFVLISMTSGQ